MILTTKFRAIFVISVLFLIFSRSNIFTTLPQIFFPKNERSKCQKINYSKVCKSLIKDTKT